MLYDLIFIYHDPTSDMCVFFFFFLSQPLVLLFFNITSLNCRHLKKKITPLLENKYFNCIDWLVFILLCTLRLPTIRIMQPYAVIRNVYEDFAKKKLVFLLFSWYLFKQLHDLRVFGFGIRLINNSTSIDPLKFTFFPNHLRCYFVL